MKTRIIEALIKHFEAHIEKHKINVDFYLEKGVGVAEHPDVMDSIEKELAQMADYQDKIEMIKTYFNG
jgi:hypothetical protein